MQHNPSKIITVIFVLVAMMAISWWVLRDPTKNMVASEPGADNRGKTMNLVLVEIGEFFKSFADSKTELSESWPRFRGANFDNIADSDIPLIDRFPENGPDTLWSVELGEGHSGAAIYKGRAYVLDYNEEKRADVLRCFDLKSGNELWNRWYLVSVKRNHGMSRTVPAVTEKYILTMGPRCHVMCLERESGDLLWGLDLVKEYGTEIPLWYTGQCPLIDNGVAILSPGGSALMIGVDCETGEKLWETPNEFDWKMSHSSIMPFEFGGQKMFVYSAVGGVCGVAADGSGKLLWQTDVWNHSVVAPSALCMPDGKIFLTAGYGAGSMMLQLLVSNEQFSTHVLAELKPSKGLASEQQTVIYYEGYLFGILPKDAGTVRNQFVCVDPNNITKTKWTSGKTNRYGLGPYMVADGKFFLLNDDGTLHILKATSDAFVELDQVNVIPGHDAWAPLALADGYLILRDSKTMVCMDVRKK